MDVQQGQVSRAGHPETKCMLENDIMLGKNKVKTQLGAMCVSGLNIQERKALCRATSWKLFANSSLVLEGLGFVNIFCKISIGST